MKEFAADINSAAKRLSRMISNMLDLDRMEFGRMTIYPEQVDVNALLTAVVGQIQPTDLKHSFRFQLDDTVPLIVGDRDKLIQVITNLVTNALKYSPDGGEILLSSCVEADTVHVQVQDQGIGIPANALQLVFERYRRIEAESTRYIKGTGLGLPLVRQIISTHGGKTWAGSTLGQGSIFHFTLPIARPPKTVEDKSGWKEDLKSYDS